MLARSNRKSYKKLLTGKDTVPTTKEYEKTVVKSKNGEDIVRFNDLNEEAFEDIILSIDHATKQGKAALVYLKTAKRPNIRKGVGR